MRFQPTRYKYLAMAVALGATVAAAQVRLPNGTIPADRFHVVIIIGHSNALGAGPLDKTTWRPDTVTTARCWNWNLTDMPPDCAARPVKQWIAAQAPLHWQNNDPGYGYGMMGMKLLKRLAEQTGPDHHFGLLANPHAPSNLEHYTPSGSRCSPPNCPTNLWNEFVEPARAMTGNVAFAGVYMEFGATDKIKRTSDWLAFVRAVREALDAPALRFYVQRWPAKGTGSYELSNWIAAANAAAIDSLPGIDQLITTVNNDDMRLVDAHHYCAEDNEIMGRRVADLMLAKGIGTATTVMPRPAATRTRTGSPLEMLRTDVMGRPVAAGPTGAPGLVVITTARGARAGRVSLHMAW